MSKDILGEMTINEYFESNKRHTLKKGNLDLSKLGHIFLLFYLNEKE